MYISDRSNLAAGEIIETSVLSLGKMWMYERMCKFADTKDNSENTQHCREY